MKPFRKPARQNIMKKYTVIFALLAAVDSAPLDISEETSHQVVLPSSVLKQTTIGRGPSIQSSAAVNLLQHEVIQTHDHPDAQKVEDVILTLEEFHQGLVHVPKSHAVSRKTIITSRLEHLINEDGIVPVVTNDVSHSEEHIQEDESLRVLPLNAVIPVTDHVNLADRSTEIKPHHDSSAKDRRRMQKRRNIYREPIGGFGVGWKYGGHGAGHGFYLQH